MTKKSASYRLNLALQGGGSHGAYTWGVLDRLLEEDDIEFAGVSGTSAGAMNAVILASGYAQGGRDGAKAALESFWTEISLLGSFSPLQQSPLEQYGNSWNLDWSLTYNFFDVLSRLASPYMFNPLNLNPLRWVLDKHLDLAALHASPIHAYITATHVPTGQARVFGCEEVTTEAVLASACIPMIFQAVEIDGEPYWDGGYMGNPAIWPLIYYTDVSDVLLVQINPLFREGTPKHATDIINRLNEITFNSSLIAEMRAMEFVSRLIRDNKLDPKKYKDVRMHMLASREMLNELNASSKLNSSWPFFEHLRDEGRRNTEDWLRANKKDIGTRATIDIREHFLVRPKRKVPA